MGWEWNQHHSQAALNCTAPHLRVCTTVHTHTVAGMEQSTRDHWSAGNVQRHKHLQTDGSCGWHGCCLSPHWSAGWTMLSIDNKNPDCQRCTQYHHETCHKLDSCELSKCQSSLQGCWRMYMSFFGWAWLACSISAHAAYVTGLRCYIHSVKPESVWKTREKSSTVLPIAFSHAWTHLSHAISGHWLVHRTCALQYVLHATCTWCNNRAWNCSIRNEHTSKIHWWAHQAQ